LQVSFIWGTTRYGVAVFHNSPLLIMHVLQSLFTLGDGAVGLCWNIAHRHESLVPPRDSWWIV